MTDHDGFEPDDAWAAEAGPEPVETTPLDDPPARPEVDDQVLVGFEADDADRDPQSSTWVRVQSPWQADPYVSGEWIADVERPAER